jgi:hypothetical protein
MMPFALGIVSGKLFDNGYFHLLQITGGIIFTVSFVFQRFSQIVLINCPQTIHAFARKALPVLPGPCFH